MSQKTRYISLLDEIKNHVFTWVTDDDWRKLPPSLNTALTTVMNELKVHNAIVNSGIDENNAKYDEKDEKSKFIAIFKQKYLEFTDLNFDEPITPVSQVIILQTIKKLMSEGAISLEFLNWFFDDFATIERNKQYMPPTINFICSAFIVNKFLFQMKESLKMRKKDVENIAVRNSLIEIAIPFLEKVKDKTLSEKMLDFSRNKINPKKFLELLIGYAKKHNEDGMAEKLSNLLDESKIKV